MDRLQDGIPRRVCIEGFGPIAVYRCGEQFFATQDNCTHAQASLSEGWVEEFEVFCPVHDARFDIRDGRALSFPATEPLTTYKIVVENGYVNIELGG
ncbi:non-heme iron oxygenase ferredoxin subunit [Paraburkholderia xenovorans]